VQPLWDHMSLNTLMDMNTWGKCGFDKTKFRYGIGVKSVFRTWFKKTWIRNNYRVKQTESTHLTVSEVYSKSLYYTKTLTKKQMNMRQY
jgi:hypothetical protein